MRSPLESDACWIFFNTGASSDAALASGRQNTPARGRQGPYREPAPVQVFAFAQPADINSAQPPPPPAPAQPQPQPSMAGSRDPSSTPRQGNPVIWTTSNRSLTPPNLAAFSAAQPLLPTVSLFSNRSRSQSRGGTPRSGAADKSSTAGNNGAFISGPTVGIMGGQQQYNQQQPFHPSSDPAPQQATSGPLGGTGLAPKRGDQMVFPEQLHVVDVVPSVIVPQVAAVVEDASRAPASQSQAPSQVKHPGRGGSQQSSRQPSRQPSPADAAADALSGPTNTFAQSAGPPSFVVQKTSSGPPDRKPVEAAGSRVKITSSASTSSHQVAEEGEHS